MEAATVRLHRFDSLFDHEYELVFSTQRCKYLGLKLGWLKAVNTSG